MKGTYVERDRKKEKKIKVPDAAGAKKGVPGAAPMVAGVPAAMPVCTINIYHILHLAYHAQSY